MIHKQAEEMVHLQEKKMEKDRKKKEEQRSPLQELNKRIPSSSSRPQCHRKPKSLSNPISSATPKSAPTSTRFRSKSSKENGHLPKKNPSFLSQCQSGMNPNSKTSQRSKLSSNSTNSLKNSDSSSRGFKQIIKKGSSSGTEIFGFKVADNNLNSIEKCTPVSKLTCWSALDSSIFYDDKPVGENSNSTNTKTPPIEPSVSPEIQSSGVSNNLLVSAAKTPVCYGAGHLLSGVTDKRKCRPRGILIIDDETNVCLDDDDIEVLAKSRPSFIPMPTEASMKWLSSPQGEQDGNNVGKCDSVDQCMTLLSSSPSTCCFPSDLVSDSDEINKSSNLDSTTSTGKTRVFFMSPRRDSNFQGISGPSSQNMDGDLLLTTPQNRSSCDIHGLLGEGNLSYRSISRFSIGEKSPFSTDFLGSCNVVQTPKSDSSSDRLIDSFQVAADDSERNEYNLGMYSVAETFDRASLSPISHTLTWDPPGFSSIDDLDNGASWITESTSQNLSLSGMRISWREGLASRIFDADEFDCCRCLSDEEKDDDGLSDKLQPVAFESITTIEQQKKMFESDGLKGPEFVEQEPSILGKGKENLSRVGPPNVYAESISIDGGGLVSSGDSDWNLCYKNHLFEV